MEPVAEKHVMAYAATQCIDDAIEATRAFLFPIDRGRWLRLAVVSFFLAAGTGVGSLPTSGGQVSLGSADFEWPQGPPQEWSLSAIPEAVWLIVAAALVALLVLGILFGVVGAVMEFVLVEALRTETVRIRGPFRRYLRAGLSLFAFQVVLFVGLLAIPLGALGFFVVLPTVSGGPTAASIVGLALLVILLGLLLVLVAAFVNGLTVEMVVPVMVVEECGVLGGWRRFWPTLRGNLAEFAVYVVLRWLITVAIGFVGSTVTGIVASVVGVPLLLIGGSLFLGTGGALTPVTVVVYALLLVAFFVVITALVAVVQVPLQTYARYYELLVLGDITPEFDLVSERRATIRSPPGDEGEGEEFGDAV